MASTCADPSAAAPPRRPRPNSGCRCFAFFCDGPRTFAPPTHCLGMYTHMTVICVCDVTSHCHRAWPQNNPLRTHAYKKRPHARAHAPAPAHSHAPGYDAHARAHAPTRACAYATALARARRTRLARPHARNAHACTRTCACTPHARTRSTDTQSTPASARVPACCTRPRSASPRPPRWRSHLFAPLGSPPPAAARRCRPRAGTHARARALNSPVGRRASALAPAPARARAPRPNPNPSPNFTPQKAFTNRFIQTLNRVAQ